MSGGVGNWLHDSCQPPGSYPSVLCAGQHPGTCVHRHVSLSQVVTPARAHSWVTTCPVSGNCLTVCPARLSCPSLP